MTELVIMPGVDYKDACDAIREKTGGTDLIKSGELGPSIREIQSGGSSYSENDDVCFWDYDGTLLYSCTLEEAQNMTSLPEVPDHSTDDIPLTFQRWNWTLEEVNALTRKADVGALYSPTDQKTHFTIKLTNISGLTVTIGWYSRSIDSVLTFDWGDGTVEDFKFGKTGGATFSHTYADYGTYNCSINPNGLEWNPGNTTGFIRTDVRAGILIGNLVLDEFATWGWPGAQGQQCFVYGNFETVVLPYNMIAPTGGTFLQDCKFLKHVNIPDGVTTFQSSCIQNCYRMKRVSLPPGFITNGDYGFAGLASIEELRLPSGFIFTDGTIGYRFMFSEDRALKSIDIPHGVTDIATKTFYYCSSLKELVIPDTVTSINADAFAYCEVMDYYFYSTTPPTLAATTAFTRINSNATIHVPKDSLEAYQTATNWVTYANYMRGDL